VPASGGTEVTWRVPLVQRDDNDDR
jgi:hypothetical protein